MDSIINLYMCQVQITSYEQPDCTENITHGILTNINMWVFLTLLLPVQNVLIIPEWHPDMYSYST